MRILTAILILLGAVTLGGLFTYGERRLLALWQDRYGPNRAGPGGVGQFVADLLKIMGKDDWVPPFSDKRVFVIAPAILVVAVLMPFAVIVFTPSIAVADLNIGLLFFLATSSLGVYGVVLGGWASNNKYAFLASLRGVAQMVSYEVFMSLSLMGVVLMAGSFSFGDIVKAQKGLWYCIPQFVGFVVFFIAGLAETRRVPFDLVEADSELVAGYHTEYSGLKFAFFYLGEYVGMLLISALTVTLFFGGWLGPWLPPIVWFILKTLILVGLFILIRAALPRPRFDQLMTLGWKILLPLSLLNLMVTGAIVLATQ